MRNIIIFLFISPLFFLVSCYSTYSTSEEIEMPKAVLLDITAKNEMGTPIKIKIRHTYLWGDINHEGQNFTLYSEWTTEHLDGGESRPIGVEKIIIVGSGGKIEELEGFILYDERFRYMRNNLISSFELEIETIDNTFIIPGYTLSGIKPDDEDILKLIVVQGWSGKCQLDTYKQSFRIFGHTLQSFILPVTITIKSDGSFSFEHNDVENGNGIRVFTRE